MIGVVHLRKSPVSSPAFILYAVAWMASVTTLFVVWPILGVKYEGLQEYYVEIGKLARVWGAVVGISLALIVVPMALRSLLVGSLQSLVLRLSKLEIVLALLFLANIGWTALGLALGNPPGYVLGDAFKGLLIPVVYWLVKKSASGLADVVFLTKVILIGETILLLLYVSAGHIVWSFAGRTFLTTVFFTLLFEGAAPRLRLLYAAILAFGFFAVVTTAAWRGIIIIFFVIFALNYYLRLREVRLSSMLFSMVVPILFFLVANEALDLKLSRYATIISDRFEESVGTQRKFFGLDESLAQRVGETIDVARSFAQSSPALLATGFGNGAMLTNVLITPSERATYKSIKKHQIYVTLVAIFFRHGLIGIALYGAIMIHIVRALLRLRRYRHLVARRREFVYFKLLGLFQVSVLILSFLAYSYIGNIIVAFTFALFELFRREMELDIRAAGSP